MRLKARLGNPILLSGNMMKLYTYLDQLTELMIEGLLGKFEYLHLKHTLR